MRPTLAELGVLSREEWLKAYDDLKRGCVIGSYDNVASALLADAQAHFERGGEVKQTLDWHDAVAKAKERALGKLPPLHEQLRLAGKLLDEEIGELELELSQAQAYARRGREIPLELKAKLAKEAADVLFVVMQAMYALNIPFEEVYNSVLASNWSKLNGGPVFREDGKLLKGRWYWEPDVGGLLRRHQGGDGQCEQP